MGFFNQVYELTCQIPKGKVTTYGHIAKALGTRDARKVGWALHQNPNAPIIPCHRVVNKNGRLAPRFALVGPEEQIKRLRPEGVTFKNSTHVNLEKHLWIPADPK